MSKRIKVVQMYSILEMYRIAIRIHKKQYFGRFILNLLDSVVSSFNGFTNVPS